MRTRGPFSELERLVVVPLDVLLAVEEEEEEELPLQFSVSAGGGKRERVSEGSCLKQS